MPITFLTDYGVADDFAGVCRAVIARIAPDVRVIDITHGIPRHDVREAGAVLAETVPYSPDAVHLAVVDPGVGGHRRALAVRPAESGHLFVAPDNGLLPPALDALGPAAEVALASDVRWRDTPRPFAAQSQQLFARYVLHAPRATLGLHAASILDPLGVIELEGLDVTADPIRLPLQHRRHALIGASLAVPAGPVVLRAELAADVRRPIHVRGETPNAMPIERHEVYRVLLGGRWTTSHGGVLDVEATYARTTARASASYMSPRTGRTRRRPCSAPTRCTPPSPTCRRERVASSRSSSPRARAPSSTSRR